MRGVLSGGTFGVYDVAKPLIGQNAIFWSKWKQLFHMSSGERGAEATGTLTGGAAAAGLIGYLYGWEAGLISIPVGGLSWFVLQLVSEGVHQSRQNAIHSQHRRK